MTVRYIDTHALTIHSRPEVATVTRLTLILLVCCLAVPVFAGDATFKFTETRRLVKGYTKPEIVGEIVKCCVW